MHAWPRAQRTHARLRFPRPRPGPRLRIMRPRATRARAPTPQRGVGFFSFLKKKSFFYSFGAPLGAPFGGPKRIKKVFFFKKQKKLTPRGAPRFLGSKILDREIADDF